MSDITLNGLSDRQRRIADLIWNCSTLEQAQTLIRSLQGQDGRDAQGIMTMIVHEVLEAEGGLDIYAEDAQAAIDHARYS